MAEESVVVEVEASAPADAPHDGEGFDYTIESIQNLREIAAMDSQDSKTENALSKLLADMPTSEYDAFWTSVFKTTQKYFVAPANLEEEQWDPISAEVVKLVSVVYWRFCDVAINWAEVTDFPSNFLQTGDLLREVFLRVVDKVTTKNILQCLERLCQPNLRLKQFYGTMSLNLVNRALEEKAAAVDVSRLYKLKHMLDFIDWDDRASLMMRGQLARCFLQPVFLKNDGISFLAHLHLVHHSFPLEIYEVLVNWVPHVRPAQNKTYSTILWKAWNKAQGDKKKVMQNVIQKWIMLAIFVAPKEAAKVRCVLTEFHHRRHTEGVSEMLADSYGPLLWRNLHVANWQVRLNCVALLMSSFPLVSTSLNLEQYEQEMEKAYKAIRGALQDQKDEVRKVAISGACRVLSTYWEMIPTEQSADMFATMINHCSRDKHTPAVRVAVCDGMRFILQGNPLAHNALKLLLPKIAHLLHDKVPSVRHAFFKVLEAVHKDGQMPLVDVVPYDQLLLRLAAEYSEYKSCPLEQRQPSPLAKRLATLIIPGLIDYELEEQLTRTVHAAEEYPLPLIALLTFADIAKNACARLSAALFQCCLRNEVHPMWPIVIGILLTKCANTSADIDLFLQRNITDEAFVKLIEANPARVDQFSHIALALGPSSLSESYSALLQSDKFMKSNQLLLLCAKGNGFTKYIKPIMSPIIDYVLESLNGTAPGNNELPTKDQIRFCRKLVLLTAVREMLLKDENLKQLLIKLCLRCIETVETGRQLTLPSAEFVGFASRMLLHWDLLKEDCGSRPQIELATALSTKVAHANDPQPGLRFLGMELLHVCGIAHGASSIGGYHALLRDIGERVWTWCGDDDEVKNQVWAFLCRVWTKQVQAPHEIFENLGRLFIKVSDAYPTADSLHTFFMYLFMKFQNSHLLESFFDTHRSENKFTWHAKITAALLHIAPRFTGVKRYLQTHGLMAPTEEKAKEIPDFEANRIFLDGSPVRPKQIENDDPMDVDTDMPQPSPSTPVPATPSQKTAKRARKSTASVAGTPTQKVTQTPEAPLTALTPTQKITQTQEEPLTALTPTQKITQTQEDKLTPTQKMNSDDEGDKPAPEAAAEA